MDADVLNALKTQAAYWAGSCERPIIIVKAPAGELKSTWKKQPLELCLEYLINSLSKETIDNGLNVIIDIQLCSWRYARNAIQYVNDLLNNKNAKLYAVRSDIFLDNCTKSQKYLNTSIVSKQRLQKIFEIEELPTELGGTLSCNHEQWLKIRIRIEDFRKSFNKVETDLDAFVESLQDLKTERQSEISEISKHRNGTSIEMQNIIKMIVKNGNKLLTELNDSLNKNHSKSRDIVDAISSVKQMLNKLEHKRAEFTALWDEFKTYMSNLKTLGGLIVGINIVTKWILGTGEEMIGKQHKIGTDLQTSETLRDSHDALEIKCCETYGFYAELNYKIKRFLNEKDGMTMKPVAFKDFIAQKQFMDFLCRGFANRLERRRIVLIASVRFYRLVTAYFERTSQCFEEHIVGNKIIEFEICGDKLESLRELKIDLENVVRELEKEGEKLSDVLSIPVKDVLGRDTGVDYSQEISLVRDILTETKNRRKIFLESAELQTLTFEQIIHIHTYERDAMMANKLIDELLSYTIKTHSYVGCNIHEIQRQKQHLQKVQETAKKIFNYGNQLLEASTALRLSCKLNDSENREQIKNLNDTWKHLDSISQEQMTRLRVSAVFHRTMEEQCQQLKELKDTIKSESDTDDKEEKLLRLRLHMLNREQLIVEIGRMVRLGKLLRTRLKEPFEIDLINGKIENESASTLSAQIISANAITGKLNEVSKIAESVDEALRETQTYLHNQTNLLERKTDGNTSIDSRGSTDELNSIAKSSTEDESFVTASECTLTPHSHSSSYETASEGGIMSPWWIGMDRNSFETCSSSDMDSEVPSMQLLSGVMSSVTNSFYDSDHSYLSAFQSPYNSGEEIDPSSTEGPDTIDEIESAVAMADQADSDSVDVLIKVNDDDSGTFIDLTNDRSSWSLVTKQTVKGCL